MKNPPGMTAVGGRGNHVVVIAEFNRKEMGSVEGAEHAIDGADRKSVV